MTRDAALIAVFVLAGCTSPLAVGEPCSDSSDCVEGTSCFFTSSAMDQSVCMSDCDETSTRLCGGGEVCIPAASMGIPRELGVCFLGGTTAVGSPCVDTFDCSLGSQCVMVGDVQSCFRACSTDDGSACEATETCEPLVGMGTKGYCAPVP